MKRLLLFFSVVYVISGYAKLVTINGIQYAFSGTSAAVVSGYDYNDKYVSSDEYMHYSNESYVIPSSIEYDGRTYSVDKIGQGAFKSSYSSKIKSIKLPATIRFISKGAFMGTSITEMIIPSKVETFGAYWWEDGSIFHNCDHLATLIYTPVTAPSNWVATTKTYVPDKVSYSSPFAKMNDAHIIEMISFADSIFSYTGQVPTTTWTNNVEGYTAALTMPTLKKDAGSYKEIIPVTFTKGEESFTANVVYRYTVKPAHLIAKAENATREYGEENPQFIISYNGFIGGEDENSFTIRPKVKTTAVKTSDVGAYPITISGGNSTNYEFEYESGLLTITAAPLSVRVADTTKVYGSKNPSFVLKYKGLKNEESSPVWIKNPNIQTDANQSSPVGQYVVIVNNGIAKNYDVTFTKGILTINKAALTISASNKSRLYYEENPTLTCSFSGFVNGDDASILSAAPKLFTTALINSSVGIYPISVNGAEAKNYSITYVAGTLEIEKRSLNASTENYTRAYNEENPTFKVNYSGFVNGETEKVLLSKPIVSTDATKNSDVGSYDITLSGGIAENYDFTYGKGKLTIEKAYQTITWNQDLSKVTQYSQVELRAQVSSGLPVTYTLSNDTVCNLNNIGSKTYLDFFHYGKVVIVAQNEGNKNYWPSLKSYKELNVDEPTGIKATTNTNRYSGKISVKNGQIIINELARGSTVSICTLSGVTLYSGTDSNIKVPAGIYIVKIGNSVTKVLVR